jgi:hypothetical protein
MKFTYNHEETSSLHTALGCTEEEVKSSLKALDDLNDQIMEDIIENSNLNLTSIMEFIDNSELSREDLILSLGLMMFKQTSDLLKTMENIEIQN